MPDRPRMKTLSVPQLHSLLAATYQTNPVRPEAAWTKKSLRDRGLIDESGRITPAGEEALRTKRIVVYPKGIAA